MTRPYTLALVVASRFGLLAGLTLWIAAGVTVVLVVPLLFRKLERPQAEQVTAAVLGRMDRLLLLAAIVLGVSLGSRMVLDGAPPPGSLLLPIGAMMASRLIAALAVGPALRALGTRMRDANAPANDAERGAFGRLQGASMLLHSLELCLAFYALYAVS